MSCRKLQPVGAGGLGKTPEMAQGSSSEEEKEEQDRSQRLTTTSLCHMTLGTSTPKGGKVKCLFTRSTNSFGAMFLFVLLSSFCLFYFERDSLASPELSL